MMRMIFFSLIKKFTIEGANESITITGWRDDEVEKPAGNQSNYEQH